MQKNLSMRRIKTDTEEALRKILAGKEERVKKRDSVLYDNVFACQITLNIPGYPKRLKNDRQAIEKFSAEFIQKWSSGPFHEEKLSNGAGICWIGFFYGDKQDAQRAKKIAVAIEEGTPEGRLFDIDIIVKGISLSRKDMGLPCRSCVLCGRPAKECAREGTHPITDIRAKMEKLIENI